jgi:hypothetical protein
MTYNRIDEALAREQVRALNGFYYHFIIFVSVLAVLTGINLATGDRFWVHWVALGWGIGVGFHAFRAFVGKPQKAAEMKARYARPPA